MATRLNELALADNGFITDSDRMACSPDGDWNDPAAETIRGNPIRRYFTFDGNRYLFDFTLCKSEDGWVQYDTDQDAHYFGTWVNVEARQTVTYAEGDLSVVDLADDEALKAEIAYMAEFYGDAPPAATGFDLDGTVTEYYTPRPAVSVQPD